MEPEPGRSIVDAWGIRPPANYCLCPGPAPAPDGAATLALEGEFDMAAAEDVRARLTALGDANPARIVLDLAAVTFMDSSTLRELLRAELALRARGGRLVLAAPTSPVTRLLSLTRATELLRVVDSVAQASPDAAA
jgi:anti-anti-sigma factor